MSNGNEVAKEGFVFVCGACGKRSKDRFGFQKIDRGWDESCMLNSDQYPEAALEFGSNGRVVRIEERHNDRHRGKAARRYAVSELRLQFGFE